MLSDSHHLGHRALRSDDFRPRPGAITPTASTPDASNRRRQRRTVSESTRHLRAISSLATPSPAHNKALACRAVRCDNDIERAIRSNSPRSSSDMASGAAIITGIPSH